MVLHFFVNSIHETTHKTIRETKTKPQRNKKKTYKMIHEATQNFYIKQNHKETRRKNPEYMKSHKVFIKEMHIVFVFHNKIKFV